MYEKLSRNPCPRQNGFMHHPLPQIYCPPLLCAVFLRLRIAIVDLWLSSLWLSSLRLSSLRLSSLRLSSLRLSNLRLSRSGAFLVGRHLDRPLEDGSFGNRDAWGAEIPEHLSCEGDLNFVACRAVAL